MCGHIDPPILMIANIEWPFKVRYLKSERSENAIFNGELHIFLWYFTKRTPILESALLKLNEPFFSAVPY